MSFSCCSVWSRNIPHASSCEGVCLSSLSLCQQQRAWWDGSAHVCGAAAFASALLPHRDKQSIAVCSMPVSQLREQIPPLLTRTSSSHRHLSEPIPCQRQSYSPPNQPWTETNIFVVRALLYETDHDPPLARLVHAFLPWCPRIITSNTDDDQRPSVDPPARHLPGRASLSRRVRRLLPGSDSARHAGVGSRLVLGDRRGRAREPRRGKRTGVSVLHAETRETRVFPFFPSDGKRSFPI